MRSLLFLSVYILISHVSLAVESKTFEHKVYYEKTDLELHVFKIIGRLPGNTLMIIGGIQGDEQGGYISADHYADIRLKKGNIIVVPRANFLSIIANQRQINEDMNRRFSQSKEHIAEDKVVAVLKDLMKESDLILNLHEGSGFYNPQYIDNMNNPRRYGQSIIADTETLYSKRCSCTLKLKEMAERVCKTVNKDIGNSDYHFRFNNHNTADVATMHAEQRKSATFYALYTLGIPAFGVEASKSIKDLDLKVRMHSMIINAFMDEMGIEFENPAINIRQPEFQFMLVRVNNDYKVVRATDVLRMQPGDTIEIKDIETNYRSDRGVTADIIGVGRVHDYRKLLKIQKSTKIIVRKDSTVLAQIPLEVSSSLNVSESSQERFYPPHLLNNPQLVWFVVKIQGKDMVVHPNDEIKAYEGDTFSVVDTVFYPPVRRQDLLVNFVGYLGGTKYGIEDDLGLEFKLNGKLLERFAIEKDRYEVYVKYKTNKVASFTVDIARPKIKYFIFKNSEGRKLCYSNGESLLLKDNDMAFYDVVSDVDNSNLNVEMPCGIYELEEVMGHKLKDYVLCKNAENKKFVKIKKGKILLGRLDVDFP